MKLFKPEDFIHPLWHNLDTEQKNFVARVANAKLEREGRIVYTSRLEQPLWGYDTYKSIKYKALLINIEPTEKCMHPREKITEYSSVIPQGYHTNLVKIWYKCVCGAQLKPTSFEVIDE